jgi:hypothetical protein
MNEFIFEVNIIGNEYTITRGDEIASPNFHEIKALDKFAELVKEKFKNLTHERMDKNLHRYIITSLKDLSKSIYDESFVHITIENGIDEHSICHCCNGTGYINSKF